MLEKISFMLVTHIINLTNQNIDASEKEVYLYGMECFLNSSLTFLLLFIWGTITHTIFETFIWRIKRTKCARVPTFWNPAHPT